jgi:hypothetical protein
LVEPGDDHGRLACSKLALHHHPLPDEASSRACRDGPPDCFRERPHRPTSRLFRFVLKVFRTYYGGLAGQALPVKRLGPEPSPIPGIFATEMKWRVP